MTRKQPMTPSDSSVSSEEPTQPDVRPIQSAPFKIEVTKGSRLGDDWQDVPYDAATKEMIQALWDRFGAEACKAIARKGRITLGALVNELNR